jgi:hypothetical protein
LEYNLRDLQSHADDFENRAGFTYTVLDPATGDVIGCVYIYPDNSEQQDAGVLPWVRASRPELDVQLGRSSFCGDCRLRPAPCRDFRPILLRDLRDEEKPAVVMSNTYRVICRTFTGATGLEPATSGVTGVDDRRPDAPAVGANRDHGPNLG